MVNAEYASVLAGKKADHGEYHIARKEMQEYQKAKKNVEMLFQAQTVWQAEAQEQNKSKAERTGNKSTER